MEFLRKVTPENFINGPYNIATNDLQQPGRSHADPFKAEVVKRFMHDNLELDAWFQYEHWDAPIYLTGPQHSATTVLQLTFYPGLKSKNFN